MTSGPIRDAATTILLRRDGDPSVLMGMRGAGAAFMPSKYVFPGGAVEPGDATTVFARSLDAETRSVLTRRSDIAPEVLAAAAIRELAEETGQILGRAADDSARPGRDRQSLDRPACDWPGFDGRLPDAAPLRFVFRAITPPGRPRRFDARFFLVPAEALVSDPDDFTAAEDELSHLHWVPLAEARALDMPFITEVVLAEVAAVVAGTNAPGTPFFDNSGGASIFRRL